MARERGRIALAAAAGLILAGFGCQGRILRVARPDTATYQSEVQEGLGAVVAILVDTSGSMDGRVPGDGRPKHVVAREALEEVLAATDALAARRPDFPVKIGIYAFASAPRRLLAPRPWDREAVGEALARLPAPGGGTAIGDAIALARPDLYRAGVFRKYVLVVTDGENTSGRPPARVVQEIHRKSQGDVRIFFIAFDTDPGAFAFLREAGGDVLAAGGADELRQALAEVYEGRILAEATDYGEAFSEPPARKERGER